MRRPFGLTISLSIVLTLFFAVVCQGDLASDLDSLFANPNNFIQANVNVVPPGDAPDPGGFCDFGGNSTFAIAVTDTSFVGSYEGWCIEPGVTAIDGPGVVRLRRVEGMSAVDCLLNNLGDYDGPAFCAWHLQWAIWHLLDAIEGAAQGGIPGVLDKWENEIQGTADGDIIEALVAFANGIAPCDIECGDLVAIVLDSENLQDLIISVRIPCPTPAPCDGKVTELTLLNNGPDANIEVVQNKDNNASVFSGFVLSGDTFSFAGTWKKGALGTEITIYVEGEPAACIHTSCSLLIGVGTTCGDFEVVAGASRNGGPLPDITPGDDTACVDCGKEKTNNGKKPAPGKSSTLSTLWGHLKTI